MTLPQQTSPAVQYLRMSTDHQRYSLGNQGIVIGAYAAMEGFHIVRTYEDAGVSGVTTAKRYGLKAMLSDVLRSDRDFDTILVLDVSRWGRYQDPDEAAHYEFICRDAGVQVRYCAEAFLNDGSGPATIMKHLKRVMAGEYSRELSERLQVAKRRQTVRGFAPGGAAPFGAQRQTINPDGTLGPVLEAGERKMRLEQEVRWTPGPPENLRTMRRIFKAFTITKRGITEIAEDLNQRGSAYPCGGAWTYARVRGVLTNEIAIGFFVYNKRPGLFKEPGRILPGSEWKRVRLFDPLVAPATFKAAARRFAIGVKVQSDDDLLERLRQALHDRSYLSGKVINEHPSTGCARVYSQRFGSLAEAYKRVGYVETKTAILRKADGTPMSDEDLLDRLRSLLERKGYLSAAEVAADPDLPCARTIRKRFGSLRRAWVLAGFTDDLGEIQRLATKRSELRQGRA